MVVSDPAGNIKPDSVKVIAMVLPTYPVIVSAIMLDTNADIIPDMFSITLNDTFQTDQRLDSIIISYNGNDYVVPAADVLLNGTVITIPFRTLSGTDGSPTGQVALCLTTETGSPRSTNTFTDGVSPAIIAADVLENEGADPDVLFITFSEPVVTGTIFGRQLLRIKQSTGDTAALTVTQVLARVNDSTFTVQIVPSEGQVKVTVGDRLRLIPGSAGGTLSDLSENRAHDLNRSVEIGFRPGAASIAGSWYLDVNADGIIDQVRVKFKRAVEQSEIDTISVRRNTNRFRIPFSSCTRLTDSIYIIHVGDAMAGLKTLTTGGVMYVTVEYQAFSGVLRNSTAVDSAAPVIVSATLLPGSFTQTGEREKDFLSVTFSEGIPHFGLSPFLLSTKKDGTRYSFTLEFLGETGPGVHSYRFTVLSTFPALPFASAGDTIWIDPSADVGDSGGVVQSNPLNRRALLQVEWPKAEWNLRISSNPFTRNTPITGQTFGSGVGIAIVLTPTAPFDEARVRAKITIYDAVGNVVKQSDFTPFNNGFRAVWRGENRKGRYVGVGTYLAVVRIDDDNNRQFIQTRKIGFMR
ncbi:MAG: hypothetical protein JXA18_15510 [Chitinispirillaceae bacterium]|nr:hypothetical protein [Chitinispirillaceae bacterium]